MSDTVMESDTERSYCEYCEYSLRDFLFITLDSELLEKFLMDHKVIPDRRFCIKCGTEMRAFPYEPRVYRCKRRHTVINKQKKKIRYRCSYSCTKKHGTIFEKSKLTYKLSCTIIASWAVLPPPRTDFLRNELLIADRTCVTLSSQLRKACAHYYEKNRSKLGSDGEIVEIDLLEFGYSRISAACRAKEKQWLFGGVQRNSRNFFVDVVTSLDSKSLLKIIKENILPGTKIISASSKTFTGLCLKKHKYKHSTVEKDAKYVNLETGNHLKNIKKLWRELRANIPRYGNFKHNTTSYIAEFYFRKCNPDHRVRIHLIFKLIADLYNNSTEVSSKVAEIADSEMSGNNL